MTVRAAFADTAAAPAAAPAHARILKAWLWWRGESAPAVSVQRW